MDKRADIWAFGVVLFEMLAGRRAFEADEVADVLARVLTQQPDWTVLPADAPAGIVSCSAAVWRRIRSAGSPTSPMRGSTSTTRSRRRTVIRRRCPWVPRARPARADERRWPGQSPHSSPHQPWDSGIAMMLRPVPADAPSYRSTILVHENLSSRATSHRFKLSPDGLRLAYVAPDASGRVMLWVRRFDSLVGQALAGTDDANAPFWSPDSRFIAFFADQKVKRIDATGGPVTVICAAPPPTGRRVTPGSWNRDDVIVIPSPDSPAIARVAAGGGTPSAVTTLAAGGTETQHGFPFFFPMAVASSMSPTTTSSHSVCTSVRSTGGRPSG